MKYCGVVTDKSFHEADRNRLEQAFADKHPGLETGIWWGVTMLDHEYIDRPRIYSDEAPMADIEKRKTLSNMVLAKRCLEGATNRMKGTMDGKT